MAYVDDRILQIGNKKVVKINVELKVGFIHFPRWTKSLFLILIIQDLAI